MKKSDMLAKLNVDEISDDDRKLLHDDLQKESTKNIHFDKALNQNGLKNLVSVLNECDDLHLSSVRFSGVKIGDQLDDLLGVFNAYDNLPKFLQLRETELSDKDIFILKKFLKLNSSVEVLELQGNEFTETGRNDLAGWINKHNPDLVFDLTVPNESLLENALQIQDPHVSSSIQFQQVFKKPINNNGYDKLKDIKIISDDELEKDSPVLKYAKNQSADAGQAVESARKEVEEASKAVAAAVTALEKAGVGANEELKENLTKAQNVLTEKERTFGDKQEHFKVVDQLLTTIKDKMEAEKLYIQDNASHIEVIDTRPKRWYREFQYLVEVKKIAESNLTKRQDELAAYESDLSDLSQPKANGNEAFKEEIKKYQEKKRLLDNLVDEARVGVLNAQYFLNGLNERNEALKSEANDAGYEISANEKGAVVITKISDLPAEGIALDVDFSNTVAGNKNWNRESLKLKKLLKSAMNNFNETDGMLRTGRELILSAFLAESSKLSPHYLDHISFNPVMCRVHWAFSERNELQKEAEKLFNETYVSGYDNKKKKMDIYEEKLKEADKKEVEMDDFNMELIHPYRQRLLKKYFKKCYGGGKSAVVDPYADPFAGSPNAIKVADSNYFRPTADGVYNCEGQSLYDCMKLKRSEGLLHKKISHLNLINNMKDLEQALVALITERENNIKGLTDLIDVKNKEMQGKTEEEKQPLASLVLNLENDKIDNENKLKELQSQLGIIKKKLADHASEVVETDQPDDNETRIKGPVYQEESSSIIVPKIDPAGNSLNEVFLVVNNPQSSMKLIRHPVISFVETYAIHSGWKRYCLGELTRSINLFPGEKKTLEVTSFTKKTEKLSRSKTSDKKELQEATDSFEDNLQEEFTTDSKTKESEQEKRERESDRSQSSRDTLGGETSDSSSSRHVDDRTSTSSWNASVSGKASWGWGSAKGSAGASGSKSRKETRELQSARSSKNNWDTAKENAFKARQSLSGELLTSQSHDVLEKNVKNAIRKVAQKTSRENRVEIQTSRTSETSVSTESKETITLENPNVGRTINYNFFQLQNVYGSEVKLDDVKIIIDWGQELVEGTGITDSRVYDIEEVCDIAETYGSEENDPQFQYATILTAYVLKLIFDQYKDVKSALENQKSVITFPDTIDFSSAKDFIEIVKGLKVPTPTKIIGKGETIAVNAGAYHLDTQLGQIPATEAYLESRREIELEREKANVEHLHKVTRNPAAFFPTLPNGLTHLGEIPSSHGVTTGPRNGHGGSQ